MGEGSLITGHMEDEIHFRLKYEIKIALGDEIQVNIITDRKMHCSGFLNTRRD